MSEEYKVVQMAADREARRSMHDHANYWVKVFLEKTLGVEMQGEIEEIPYGRDTGVAWYKGSIKLDCHKAGGKSWRRSGENVVEDVRRETTMNTVLRPQSS